MGTRKTQTVGAALRDKRRKLAGRVKSLTLCKRELYYHLSDGTTHPDTVYPVLTHALVASEAKHFGVPWSEQ